jgi:hypothetical protein
LIRKELVLRKSEVLVNRLLREGDDAQLGDTPPASDDREGLVTDAVKQVGLGKLLLEVNDNVGGTFAIFKRGARLNVDSVVRFSKYIDRFAGDVTIEAFEKSSPVLGVKWR